MPRRAYRPPKEGRGKTRHVYLKGDALKMSHELENFSAFVQLALSQAVGIMTWALLKEKKPDLYYDNPNVKLEDVLPKFNEAYPLDPLTARRNEKRENSVPKPELW